MVSVDVKRHVYLLSPMWEIRIAFRKNSFYLIYVAVNVVLWSDQKLLCGQILSDVAAGRKGKNVDILGGTGGWTGGGGGENMDILLTCVGHSYLGL